MSPRSTFAFVLLAAFAISTPVQASVTKTDTVSYTDLTTALCASLHYTPRGVNSLFDACVASKLLVTANAHTTRAILKSGLTTAICTSLDLKVIGSSQIHDACVAAGLLVAADVALKPQEINLSTSTDLYANAFLSSANGCNSLSSQLNSLLAGVARLTAKTVASLSVDVIIPTILKIDASLNEAVVVTANSVSCTDAAVEATVLQSYTAFVTGFSSLLSSLSSSLTLCSSAEVKSLNSALAHLRSTLVVYTHQLDNYLAADLEQSSVKAALFLSLDAAVHATA